MSLYLIQDSPWLDPNEKWKQILSKIYTKLQNTYFKKKIPGLEYSIRFNFSIYLSLADIDRGKKKKTQNFYGGSWFLSRPLFRPMMRGHEFPGKITVHKVFFQEFTVVYCYCHVLSYHTLDHPLKGSPERATYRNSLFILFAQTFVWI